VLDPEPADDQVVQLLCRASSFDVIAKTLGPAGRPEECDAFDRDPAQRSRTGPVIARQRGVHQSGTLTNRLQPQGTRSERQPAAKSRVVVGLRLMRLAHPRRA
jgi:hypothetical protein